MRATADAPAHSIGIIFSTNAHHHREWPVSRRKIFSVATLITTTAVLIASCSGSNEKSQADDKDGSPVATPRNPSPSNTGSLATIDRPKITLPSDLRMAFAREELSDPAQKAALNDAENFLRSINYAILRQDAQDPAYKFYSYTLESAQKYAYEEIKKRVNGKASITGIQIFSGRVKMPSNKKSATVYFCRDNSRLYDVSITTGKVRHREESISDYSYLRIEMKRSARQQGLWLAKEIHVDEKVEGCMA
ncbi:hypothetical protein [Streptomyces ureilyticus]|uniref:Lipoprotein n=1 Tax=Streptomyces ureilyticus TaxID=1775131 RepID=A0ABX0DZP5_9ACTN|nr:hypothetical protein [Streptomyces ureilyticus]NGO45758.1 hypothetical protein [Streptomyces ureilyticus]